MSKREEGALTFGETLRLFIHLLVCEFCRRFLKQTNIIGKTAKRAASRESLTSEKKQKMKGIPQSDVSEFLFLCCKVYHSSASNPLYAVILRVAGIRPIP